MRSIFLPPNLFRKLQGILNTWHFSYLKFRIGLLPRFYVLVKEGELRIWNRISLVSVGSEITDRYLRFVCIDM